MSNIYGIYGSGIPGITGEKGQNGYNISVNDNKTKDGSVLTFILDNNDSSAVFSNYYSDEKKYTLSSLDFTVYKNINSSTKYYQFNYSLNNENVDNLKIFAYIFYNNNNIYNQNNDLCKYIVLKDFYNSVDSVKSNIQYIDNKKITKIILFAFEKVKGYVYNKIYLGEKEF